jgi:hypothetical protein
MKREGNRDVSPGALGEGSKMSYRITHSFKDLEHRRAVD